MESNDQIQPFDVDDAILRAAVMAAHTAYTNFLLQWNTQGSVFTKMHYLTKKQDAYEEVCKALGIEELHGYGQVKEAIEEKSGPLTQVIAIVQELEGGR